MTATPSTSGDAEVELEWTDPNNSSITKWQLLQATGNSIFVVGTGSAQEITLSWTDPNKSNILSWWYSHKAHDGSWSAWTRMAGADANSTSHTLELTLTDGKRYTFQARARVSGEVHYNATGLLVHAKITPTGPTNNKLSYDATGLEHNVAYEFLLRAVNASGNGAPAMTNPVRPVAGAPGAPALAASISGSQASLSWTKNADGRWADKWQYRKKTTANWPSTTPYGWADISGSDDTTRSHAVTGLDNGKTYDFQVRAVNNAGNGTASTSASASTIPAKPAGFAATAKTSNSISALFTQGQVDLSWTNPNNSTITRWEYRYKSKVRRQQQLRRRRRVDGDTEQRRRHDDLHRNRPDARR